MSSSSAGKLRRNLGRLVAAIMAFALSVTVGGLAAIAAPPNAAHAAGGTSCVKAKAGSGPLAETICWLSWADLDIVRANGGTAAMTFTLDGGSTITMDVSITGTAARIADVPTWSGAQFGQSVYRFDGTPPLAIYSASGAIHNDQTVTLGNIKARYSSGLAMTEYSMVVADAETTFSGIDGDEYIEYSSDKPLNLATDLGNACKGGFSGEGTTSVTCVSGPYGNRPTTTPVLVAQAPTTMSAHMGENYANGSQGVAFGVVVASAAVTKVVNSRYLATDSFTVTARNQVGAVMGSASTGGGTTATAGPYLDLGTFTGAPAFTLEETGDGSTDLTKYTKQWACTTTKTTASGTTTTPLTIPGSSTGNSVTVPASIEDAVACTVTNTAKPADILITKTAVPASGNTVGQPFSYRITAKNQADSPVDGVTVSDDVPAGLTIGATSPTATVSGQSVTWANESLAARQTKTYTIQVTPTAAGTYPNTAVAKTDHGCQTDGSAEDCSGDSSTVVGTGENLKVSKTILSGANPKPGEWITYAITAQNLDGKATLHDQTITDDVPTTLTNVSIVTPPTGATASLAGNKLTMTIPAGTTMSPTVTIKGQVSPTAQAGQLDNSATLSGGCNEAAGDCTATAGTAIGGSAAAIVVDKQGPASAAVGSTISYTITATNTGDIATSRANTITDQLPTNLDPASVSVAAVPSSATIDYNAGTVTWTLPAGMLPATMGPTYKATITAKIKAGASLGTMTNTASMAATPDCTTGCTDSVDTTVTNSTGALSVKKTSNPATGVHPGDTVTYSFAVTNSGLGELKNVKVTDDDALFAADQVVCPGGSNTIATLPQGQTVTCAMTHRFTDDEVATGGKSWGSAGLTNTASAAGTDANDVPVASAPASATTKFDVTLTPTISKSATAPSPLRAGDTITYAINVAYNGDGQLINAQLNDPMFPSLASSCTPAIPVAVDPGFTSTCTATHTVTEQDIRDNWAQGAIKNTAVFSGNSGIWPTNQAQAQATKIVPIDTATPMVAFTGSKVATPTSANPGDTVTYTVTAKNTGQLTATNVVVYDSFKGGAPTAIDPARCTWPAMSGTLKSGESVTCTYPYTVQVADAATTIHNAATAGGDNGTTPVGPTPIGTADVAVSSGTAVTITKTNDASSNRVRPGQSFDYTITARNDGEATAKGVVLSDTLPKYVTFTPATQTGWTYDAASRTVTSDPFDVAGGGATVPKTFSVQVDQNAPSEQQLLNIGTVQGMATPEECQANPAKAGCAIDNKPLTVDDSSVTVAKSNNVTGTPKVVRIGDRFSYTVTASNAGASDATDVVITDKLPAGLAFESTSQPGWDTISGDTAVSMPLTVKGKSTASLTLNVVVDSSAKPGQLLLNVMALAGTDVEDCVTNPSKTGCGKDTDPPSVVDHSKVTVTKVNNLAGNPPMVKPGQSFTYTIRAINSGATVAQKVSISDTLPAGLEFDGAQNSAWTITGNTATLKTPVDVPTGTTGLSWDLRVKVAADAQAGYLRNIAVMDGQDPSACQANASNACGVDPNPPYVNTVVLTKTAGLPAGSSIKPGDTVSYTFTADNSKGTKDVAGYRIIDSIPGGSSLSPNPQTGWTIVSGAGAAGTVVQSAAFTVPAGQKVTKTLSVKVLANASAGTVIDNIGTIAGGQTPIDQCVLNPTQPDCVEDDSKPKVDDSTITLTKTNSLGSKPQVLAGDSFTYSITASNSGVSAADGVVVTDQLPAGLAFDGAQDSIWAAPDVAARTITSKPFSVPGKSDYTLTLRVTVLDTAVVNSTLTNVVALDGTSTPDQCLADTGRTLAGCAWDDNSPTVVDHSGVTIEKKNSLTSNPARVKVGQLFSYTITATNRTTSLARNVSISDTLPAGLDLAGSQDSRWVITGGGRTLTYLTDIPAGQAVTLPVNVVVAPDASGTIRNAAVIDGGPAPDCTAKPTPAGCDPTAPDVDTVIPSKTSDVADGARVKPGQLVTYTFTADNSAGKNDVTSYGFIDQVPAGMALSPSSQTNWKVTSGTGAAGTVVQSNPLFTVPAGSKVTRTLTLKVDPGAKNGVVIRNVGTIVNGDTPIDTCVADPTLPDCYTEPTNHDVDDSDVTLVKSNDVSQSHKLVRVGDSYTYTIRASNSGTSVATGVQVSDKLPQGLVFDGAQDSAWNAPDLATMTIQSKKFDIPAKGYVDLIIKVKVAEGASGQLVNAAAVDGTVTPDQCIATPSLPGCGVDTNPTTVDNTALSATKTASVGSSAPIKPGQAYSYSIVASNGGSQPATAVTVTDKLPAGLIWSASSDFPTPPVAGVVTSAPFDLAALASKTLTLTVTVDPNATPGLIIQNVGAITKADDDGPTITDCVKDPSLPQCFEEPGDHTVDDSNITITKTNGLSGNPPLVTAGDTFTYSLVVKNTGNTTDPNVVVTDQLPAGLTFDPAPQSGWTFTGQTARFMPFALPGKTQVTLTLSVTVADGLATGTVLKNVSAVAGSTSGGTPVDQCVADETKPGCGPDKNPPEVVDHSAVTVEKTNNLGEDPLVRVGDSYTYTIKATNTGSVKVSKVKVSDTLPAGLAFTGRQAGWTIDETTASFYTDLDAGQSVSKTLTVTVLPGARGTIRNAVVKDDGTVPTCDVTPTPAGCDDNPPNVDNTDISVVKTSDLAAGEKVKVGKEYTYTFTVTNSGTEKATGQSITDTLPAGLDFALTPQQDWTINGRTAVSAPFDLGPNGAVKTLELTVKVVGNIPAGSTIENTACTVNLRTNRCGTDPQPPTFDDSTIVLTKVNDTAKWSNQVQVGDTYSYTITATNTGHTTADGVVITDTLPAGLEFATTPQSGWQTLAGNDAVSVPLQLKGGAHVSLTLQVKVSEGTAKGTLLRNAVAVDGEITPAECLSNTDEVLPGCGIDPLPPEVVDHSEVTISKSNSVDKTDLADNLAMKIVKPGQSFTYTITVTNRGGSLVRNVLVSDTLPAGLSFDGTQAGWTMSGAATVSRTLASLQPGEIQSFTIKVTVNEGFSGTLTNVAVIDDTDPATCLANSEADGCGVDPDPLYANDVRLVKSNDLDGAPTLKPGQSYTYTIKATNAGSGTATGIVVVDQLPAGIEAYPATQQGWTFSGAMATSAAFSLASGETRELKLAVRVKVDAPAGALIENAAVVKGIVTPETCLDNPSLVGCGVDPDPAVVDRDVMSIEKTNDLAEGTQVVNLGRSFGYEITVRNAGYVDATNVTVADQLPAGLVPDGASQADWASITGGLALSKPFDLAAGQFKTLHIQVLATKEITGLLHNVAALTGFDMDGTSSSTNGTPIATCVANAATKGCAFDDFAGSGERTGILIAKSNDVASGIVRRGQSFTYTIAVTNTTSALSKGITLSDTLPAGLTYAGTQDGWTIDGPRATLTEPFDLAAGASRTFTLTVTVASDATGVLKNIAVLDDRDPAACAVNTDLVGCGLDPNPPVVDQGTATLSVKKVAATRDVNRNGVMDAGDQIRYSFLVTNTGDKASDAGLLIDDPMLQAAGIAIVCPTGEIAAGSTVTCKASAPYVITAVDAAAGKVRNVAVASIGDTHSAPATVTVTTSSRLPTSGGDPTTGTGALPYTGVEIGATVLISLLLLGLGSFVLAVRRRRGETHS